jgi:type IV pilus assembly protein PilC
MRLSRNLPSQKQLSLWMKQLATMLHAGVPIIIALSTLKQQTSQRALNAATDEVLLAVLDGDSLAQGFARNPTIFSPLVVSLIAAGERAGILEHSLETICRNLEEKRALRSRLLRATTYPLIVLGTLAFVIMFLLTWVIPTFEDLFHESGIALPWLTQAVIKASRVTIDHWALLLLTVVSLCTGGALIYRRSKSIRTFAATASLSTPLLKDLNRKRYTYECTTLLASLLRAGIPIIAALEILTQTVQNSRVSHDLTRTRSDLQEGLSLSASFARSQIFPAMVSQMISIGEASGHLEEMLAKTGALFRQEVDEAIETIKQLAEPALVLLIGIIVGTLVLAIYLPIFQLGDVSGIR